jgi:hypothetical protein
MTYKTGVWIGLLDLFLPYIFIQLGTTGHPAPLLIYTIFSSLL